MNSTSAPVFDKNVRDREVASVKVPPHSLEAERSLLGSLLLDNNSFDDVAVIVIEDDFYLPSHREIYKAISELYNKDKPCDILTITDHLTSLTRLEAAGGETYIYEIVKSHQIDSFVKSSYARHANLEERGVLIARRNDEK